MRRKGKKSVAEILKLPPEGILTKIGQATDIDYGVSRLRGDIMVKLLIFSMLRSDRLSTRVLEHFYNSPRHGDRCSACFQVKEATRVGTVLWLAA